MNPKSPFQPIYYHPQYPPYPYMIVQAREPEPQFKQPKQPNYGAWVVLIFLVIVGGWGFNAFTNYVEAKNSPIHSF